MTLPHDFQFSQASLQDYGDCRRRFQLRYVERLAWPALLSEPALESELHTRQGALFHHRAHQFFSGAPAERLASPADGPSLSQWWANFLASQASLPGLEGVSPTDLRLYPEITLSIPLGGFRLVAKYDLVAALPGRRLIFDWKTSLKRPRRSWLAERLQTRVYPYVLSRAGAGLDKGESLPPEQVEMIYWFANFPDQPERFPYSQQQFTDDEAFLTGLLSEIAGLGENEYFLTPDEKRCAYCQYRSLCDRGVRAGPMDAPQEDLLDILDLDFSTLEEIEY